MPRGTLDRLLVILVSLPQGGPVLFWARKRWPPAAALVQTEIYDPAPPTARAVPPRLRLPPRVSLGTLGDETLAAQGQPAVASTTASEDETMPDAGPAGLGLWRRTRQGWEGPLASACNAARAGPAPPGRDGPGDSVGPDGLPGIGRPIGPGGRRYGSSRAVITTPLFAVAAAAWVSARGLSAKSVLFLYGFRRPGPLTRQTRIFIQGDAPIP